ncbi:hypothetical protein PQO03_15395 [Lentisphaera profundi]|uniref:Uncharacterized protein n=1 Tax=Lentisphaera profundi TaxID=1658616 RepID=A0ABY7W2M7_9BACT|nr:hypothetical protein [Lentisphaera profundi]WDE99219.1 hypothetical protein PQO03_15395 [Lentisphaera profundi]
MKFLYFLILLTLSSCSSFDGSKHYFSESSVLIISRNDTVKIENIYFKKIYSEGRVLSRDGEILELSITSYKPKYPPEDKVIKVELLPLQKFLYMK